MGGFIRGLFTGLVLCGIAFSAAAIVFPRQGDTTVEILERPEQDAPAQGSSTQGQSGALTPATPQSAPTITPPQQQSTGLQIAAPSVSGGGQGSDSTPSIGGGLSLSAPNVADGSGAGNLGANADSAPTRRTNDGSTKVAIAEPVTSRPTVDTASTAAPEVGGVDSAAAISDSDKPALTKLSAKPLVAGKALTDNAIPFNGDSDRPLMAIILQDSGVPDELRRGLLTLSAPITFGVTANLDNASGISANYAQKGFEIVAVLPSLDQPIQRGMPAAEVNALLSGVFDAVPSATALVDQIDGDLPRDPALVKAALETLKITGHGLLTHRGSGLNNVPQQAVGAGVPSDIVFRVVDDVSDPAAIRQELDRAVLEASKSGRVIVIGRVQPDTVTTLFSWLLSPSASAVTIAPVSTVMSGGGF
ncbi:divergent polysaccharide deacetylase family protein [Halovulum sp. GXIMD14793]